MDDFSFKSYLITLLRDLFQEEVREFLASQQRLQQSSPDIDELLTVQQTAEFLNLAVATVYIKVQRKELPVCKRAGRLYFSKNELIDYVKGGRKKTQAEIEAQADQFLTSKKRRG